ncbi:MAG: tRNA (guanosine(37)-N1)-methyltransferase TrmD [Pseudomonadota bacterium]
MATPIEAPAFPFSVVTIFPELVTALGDHGIIRRALDGGYIRLTAVNPRDYTTDRHRTTDDRPYGGGAGMVMKPEPLAAAIDAASVRTPGGLVVLLTPQGRPFNQQVAAELASTPGLVLVCGRYEGVDERIAAGHIDLDVSIGDFVLTGGELAAMIIIDAVTRLIPGALGNTDSAGNDSFSDSLLEHGHYTRPRLFEEQPVPEVLLSGNHQAIARWRLETALVRTLLQRPDLLQGRPLTPETKNILKAWRNTIDRLID